MDMHFFKSQHGITNNSMNTDTKSLFEKQHTGIQVL